MRQFGDEKTGNFPCRILSGKEQKGFDQPIEKGIVVKYFIKQGSGIGNYGKFHAGDAVHAAIFHDAWFEKIHGFTGIVESNTGTIGLGTLVHTEWAVF